MAPLSELIRRVLIDLAADPKPSELERAKAQFTTSLFLNFEGAGSRASAFASQMSVFDKVFALDEVAVDIAAVTRDDLVRVGAAIAAQPGASALLGPKSMTLAA
ncbi:hypothetical protein [Asticcacaulis biprosthecium]|uniref:hypothetical protein n=1 Tax=Asticcacaulis biprosthecium TaxID=76891 RepID=UPI0002ECD4A5|nr:hypothetical protein [Asticcacaulis biprosthecium]